MKQLTGLEIGRYIKNPTYEKKQAGERSYDLTVKAIRRLVAPGRVDFGGSEFEEGRSEPVLAEKIHPDEPYGWWHLEGGEYILEYNESLGIPRDHLALLQPSVRITVNGATHETRVLTEGGGPIRSRLAVGPAGIWIKENARVSSLVVLKLHK